jgi:N-acetylglucosamine kinase-like BadF-type ATPase
MAVFLGFDCGGTSCRAMALDAEGDVLFTGHAGPGNIVTTPEYYLRKHLQQASRECPPPDRVCGCFAGLLTKDDHCEAVKLLKELFPKAACKAEPDYHAALMSCKPGTHACVVAGTGSVVCSRIDGRLVKTGGRGFLLGDFGSTAQYGRDALAHFLNVGESSASARMRDCVRERFDSLDESDIVSRLYRHPSPVSLMVRLASPIVHDYKAGESYAIESVRRNTRALAAVAAQHCMRHFPQEESLNIVLAGGLWKLSEIFKSSFEQELAERLGPGKAQLSRIGRPPVYGAAMLAKEST